jgi:hypothetical protein
MAQLERRDRAARDGTRGFDVRSLTVQAAKANEVIRWKSFSWTRLFNELEALQPHDVRMTSVRPLFLADQRVPPGRAANVDSSAVPVAVEGAAKTLDDFLDLERELLRDPSFSRIEPERSARAESTGETLFQLRFVYDPAHSLAALTAGDLPAPTAPTAPNDDEPAAPEVEAPVDPSGSPANGSGDAADAARPRSEASATAPTAQLTEIRSQGRGRWPVATPSGETP